VETIDTLEVIGLIEWNAPRRAEPCETRSVHVSARADYAVRAAIELARATQGPTTADQIAAAQAIPRKYLNAILLDLKRSQIVRSHRGANAGYSLARPAKDISVAEVMRGVDGQIADIRGFRPEDLEYTGSAEPLQRVWIAARAAMRSVLDEVSIAQLATDSLPAVVGRLTKPDRAWH